MAGNCYWKRWVSWSWRGKWMRGWKLACTWLWCSCAMGYGQLPPAPPGFAPSTQSPKGAEQKLSLGPVMIASGSTTSAASTNHAAPVVSIRWALAPTGCVEIDPALTNQVPIRLVTGAQFDQALVGVEWVWLAGKTYEVQVMVNGFGPVTYMRLTATADGAQTAWCGIDPRESSRFFRVRSD